MATKQNLTIRQGGRFKKEWVWKTGSPPAPVNLSGYTAEAQIRQTYSGDLILDLEPYTTLGTTGGEITIDIPASATEDLNWVGEARWDLHLITGGNTERFFEGAVFLSLGVTRNES
jgi:hypothetical protein